MDQGEVALRTASYNGAMASKGAGKAVLAVTRVLDSRQRVTLRRNNN